METQITRAEMLSALRDKDSLLWVDLESPTEFDSECLVEIFNFHPLAVEDCLTDHSQPKIDDYEEYLFLVLHSIRLTRNEERQIDELETEQLNIFIGRNYVITFHKDPLKSVQAVREGLKRKPERFMGQGADLLMHSILDRLVDNYTPVLNQYDRKIDQMEEEVFNNPPTNYLANLMQLKTDIFNLRHIVAPQRDTLNYLTRTRNPFIRQKHLIYYRDIYDHLFRIYGTVEGFHENLSSILQAYFTYSSHKLNEVMKHMTVLATLTMPSIIVASIFGMNFRHMPGLQHEHGYLASVFLMIIIPIIMLVWMKLKKWI